MREALQARNITVARIDEDLGQRIGHSLTELIIRGQNVVPVLRTNRVVGNVLSRNA